MQHVQASVIMPWSFPNNHRSCDTTRHHGRGCKAKRHHSAHHGPRIVMLFFFVCRHLQVRSQSSHKVSDILSIETVVAIVKPRAFYGGDFDSTEYVVLAIESIGTFVYLRFPTLFGTALNAEVYAEGFPFHVVRIVPYGFQIVTLQFLESGSTWRDIRESLPININIRTALWRIGPMTSGWSRIAK